jgi:hypothetical protein
VKKAEAAFLLSVLGIAGAFSLMSISQAVSLQPSRGRTAAAAAGAAGQARDVDVETLRRLLRQGYLSEHEAEFYKQLPASPGSAKAQPPAEKTRPKTPAPE